MNNKKEFILNLVIILLVSLAAAFFISTKIYKEQWQEMMSNIEEILNDSKFNLVEEIDKKEDLDEKMIFSLNNQIFLVAQKKEVVGEDFLKNIYFGEDFLASAVVITNDGWLLTATNLENYTDLVLITNEKEIIPVQEIFLDSVLGLSYLKIDKKDLNPAAILDSDNLKIGENVYAIQPNHYNYQHEIIKNSIRNLHSRYIENRTDLIYSSSDYPYGLLKDNISGDLALFNDKSQFIGFSANLKGKSYLLPSKYIIYSFTNFFKGEKEIFYPSIGIRCLDLSEITSENDLPNKGAYVYEILDKESKLKVGDIITYIENDEINEIRSLNEILLDYQIKDEIKITLIREGQEKELRLIINSLESKIE